MGCYTIDKTKMRPRTQLYIALDELDFSWYSEQVEQVIRLWDKGYSLQEISDITGREGDEVFLLLMSLARDKLIAPRANGLFGRGD